ncbi:hypothetical protein RvY_04821-2 [Ramazzottius varieornatus]|uniref:Non-specific serine/threonine protein kinase n=1 Tax=Ramazzottius varieornatus TaxID=947166 RepID=A0A1D1UTJ8_RAMVA|nr:hypothetical protein RvY_04821-2 [Ramazzottius varieornatus]
MSISAHSGNALSFRDDLESLAYVLVYFIKGRLPWQGIHEKDASKKSALIKSRKSGVTVEDICSGCPIECTEFLRYARGMRFAEEPNYVYLKNLFREALDRHASGNDSGMGEEIVPAVGGFDWLGKSFAVRKEPATHPILPRAEFQKKISVPALTPTDKLQLLHQRSSAVAFSARPSSQVRKKRSDGENSAMRNKPSLGQTQTTLAQPRPNETPLKPQVAAQRFQGSKQSSARTNQPLADQQQLQHQQGTPRITKNSEDMSWNEVAKSVGNLSSVEEKHTPPERRSEKAAETPRIVFPPTPERTRKSSPGVSVPPQSSLLSVRTPSATKSVSSPLSKSTKNLFTYLEEELAKAPASTAKSISPLSSDNDSSDDEKDPGKPASQTGLLTLTVASSTDGDWSHVAHAPLKMSPVPLPEAKDFSIDLSQKKTVEDGAMLPKPKLPIPIQVQPSSRTALNGMTVTVSTPKGTTKVGPLRALLPKGMKGEPGPKKTQPTIQINEHKSPASSPVPPNVSGGVDPKNLHRISTYDVKRDGSQPMPSIFRASCFGWLRKRAVCPGSRMHRSSSLQYPAPGNTNEKAKVG